MKIPLFPKGIRRWGLMFHGQIVYEAKVPDVCRRELFDQLFRLYLRLILDEGAEEAMLKTMIKCPSKVLALGNLRGIVDEFDTRDDEAIDVPEKMQKVMAKIHRVESYKHLLMACFIYMPVPKAVRGTVIYRLEDYMDFSGVDTTGLIEQADRSELLAKKIKRGLKNGNE